MGNVAWPLRVAASGRYLEDAAGRPFRLNVDAAWFASTEFWLADAGSAAAFEEYLRDRAGRGFSGMLLMGMVQSGYNSYRNIETGEYGHLPANRVSGAVPLLTPDDFRTPNPEYWSNVSRIVGAAGRHGIAVLLAYNYLGYPGTREGWWEEIGGPANSVAGMRWFGTWLAGLLAEHGNVIWYPYGDMNPPAGEGSLRVRATVEAIREALPGALFAAELNSPDDVVGDNPDADGLLSLNGFYGYGPDAGGEVWRTAERAWSAVPVRPAFVCEPQYEGAEIGGSGAVDDVREAEWWSVLGGGTAGQVFGRVGVYNFAPNSGPWSPEWRKSLDSPGARQMAYQFAFWASLPWWELRPAGVDAGQPGAGLVVGGQGDGLRHIAAAGTPDGAFVVAYVPNRDVPRGFAVDGRGLGGPGRAAWFDPTSGVERPAGEVAAGAVGSFETPGANAAGAGDWVLVIRA
jgi:hypothetical protein